MKEKDFLSLLVDETFELQKSHQADVSHLEHQLRDFNLNFLKGEFIPQLQMLRFTTSLGQLDLPVNWSHFSDETELVLSSQNDPDLLFTVLEKSWLKKMTKLLITHADGFCYLVGLRKDEEFYLRDLIKIETQPRKVS